MLKIPPLFIATFVLSHSLITAQHTYEYAKQNEYGFAYPSSNWSYVPCYKHETIRGQNDCREFTGNARSECYSMSRDKNSPLSKVFACACEYPIGFAVSPNTNCSRGSFDPRCVVSEDACTGRLPGLLFLFIVYPCLVLIQVVYNWLRTGRALILHFKSSEPFRVKQYCLLYMHLSCTLFSAWIVAYPNMFFKDRTYSDAFGMSIGIPATGMFFTLGLLTISFSWLQAYNSAKLMRINSSGLKSKYKVMLFLASTTFGVGVFTFFFILQKKQLGAMYSLLFIVLLAASMLVGSSKLSSLLARMSMDKRVAGYAGAIQTCSRKTGFCLTCYALSALAYSLTPDTFLDAVNTLRLSFIMVLLTSVSACSHVVINHLLFEVTTRVAPTSTQCTSSAEGDTSKSAIFSTALSDDDANL